MVVNKIKFHPPDTTPGVDNNLDEYVEIYNMTPRTTFLYDTNGTNYGFADGHTTTWQISGIVNFHFPTNVSLDAGQALLLVSFSPTDNPAQLNNFRNKYGTPGTVQVFGPYTTNRTNASLINSGGHIDLFKPDPPQDTNHGDFGFVPYILVDKVVYSNAFPWPAQTDGTGKALQRIAPDRY